MIKTAAIVEHRPTLEQLLEAMGRRALLILTFVSALAIYSQFRFWAQPSTGDRANWDYFAQVIVRGGVPYRDVVNIKTPLSAYLGAAAIVVARPFGIRDLLAMRLAYVFMAALTVAFTFLVALDYFQSYRVSVLAAIIMLAFNVFGKLNSGGIQPKTPMVLFGLVALWAIIRDRPFVAGLASMLSALSWQPGLLFAGVAGLAFSRYFTSWRDLKVLKLAAGAVLPLALLVIYFWATSALRGFYLWNIDFNYSVYAPRGLRSLSNSLYKFSRVLTGSFRSERIYFYLAGLGLLGFVWLEARRAAKGRGGVFLERAPRHAIVLAPAIYFAFCLINMQGNADTIPLLPFVAILASVFLIGVLDLSSGYLRRLQPRLATENIKSVGFLVLSLAVFIFSVADVFSIKRGFPKLKDQQAEVAQIVSNLEPGDQIFVHGQTQILALSGLPNASKYFFLDRGKDEYLDVVEPGGFAGWFEQLKEIRPKVVALDRIRSVKHKEDFFAWVRDDYEVREGRIFTYYVRKDAAQ